MKKSIIKSLTLTMFALFCAMTLVFGIHFSNRNTVVGATSDDSVKILDGSSSYLDTNYLDIYSIPTEKFVYSTDGGQDDNLKNAFDRNFNSYWESDWNNKNLVDHKIGKTIYIEMDFDSPYSIDRVIFGNQPDIGQGFPIEFKIYGKVDTEWQEIGLYYPQYDPHVDPNKFVMVSFEPTILNGIKFEYRHAHETYRWSATCRELILLQPECNEMEQVRNLFDSYNELELSENIKSQADIKNIRAAISGYASEAAMEEKLKRAEQILAKTIRFDPLREMSTDANAANVITQRGDIADYARNVLKMAWFGTNRQPTGIYVKPHEVLTVYVEAQEGDKLPTIYYSQFWGHWKKWLSQGYQLKPGKNVIEVQSLIHDISEYTLYDEAAGGPVLGGPVYISNPYEADEQSNKVKVYFEGGTPFPVYRLGGDETRYKLELQDYAKFVQENLTTAINVTELVSENFIMTVRATVANDVYQNHSPEQNLKNWDAYIKEVLAFDGVVFTPDTPHYDERSQYLNCNIRMAQPIGEAYAHVEHVGIQSAWEQAVLYTESFGWGYTHELGHMMDNPERTISECSNNMMSKYNETAMEKDASRGEFESTLNSLSPDDYTPAFFDKHDRLNYLIWWLIESYDIGFWAKLENLYRYEPVTGLASTEKQVYLASLAVGFDLSYYFERFGYSMSGKDYRAQDPIFTIAGATPTFKNYMCIAEEEKRITSSKQPKLWYLDSKQYLKKLEGETSCYEKKDIPKIVSVTKSGNGYNIIMSSSKSNLDAHLGYEILDGGSGVFKVVGFSHSDAWTDTRTLDPSYEPIYQIVAYDRKLNASGSSTTQRPGIEKNVCRLNKIDYSSLSAAVKNANNRDTIYIYEDCSDSDIVIDKDITIRIDEGVSKNITISLAGKHNLFYVLYEKTLNLYGNSSDQQIILDGGGFVHEGSLVRLAGYMNMEYVTLKNSISKTDGGAIRIVYEGSYQALNANNVVISGCSGKRGGAIYDGSNYMTVTLNNCKIFDNSADYGGAVFMESNMNVYIKNSEIYNNSAIYGGAVAGCSYIEINASKVYGNAATKYGGAICFSTTVEVRQVYLKDGTEIYNNRAELGSAAYIKDGVLNVINAKIFEDNVASLTDSDGSKNTIYLKNSVLSVHVGNGVEFSPSNTATFGGTIYIDNNSRMLVYGKAFEVEESKLKIILEECYTGKAYCEAMDFEFSDDDRDKLVDGTYTKLETNEDGHSSIVIALPQVEFTFVVNGKLSKVLVDVNSMFTLPYECGLENQYAISWLNGNNPIASGEEIQVKTAQTFTAVLGKKVLLQLIGDEADKQLYFIPGTNFILPRPTYASGQFICWLDDEGNEYFAYSQIELSSNKKLYANIASKLKVKFKLNGEEFYSGYVVYDEYLEFPNIDIPEGKRIAYYLVNGEKTSEGYLNATSDVVIDAILENIPNEAVSAETAPEKSSSLITILSVIGAVLVVVAVAATIIVLKKKKSKKA